MATSTEAQKLRARLPEGLLLLWLPANQAWVVTWGWNGPILVGPAPLREVADWVAETYPTAGQ